MLRPYLCIDFELPPSAVEQLNALECHGRGGQPLHWGVDIFGEKGDEFVKEVARKDGQEYLARRAN